MTYYLFGRGFGEGLGIDPARDDTSGGGDGSETTDEGDDDTGDDRIPDPDPLT